MLVMDSTKSLLYAAMVCIASIKGPVTQDLEAKVGRWLWGSGVFRLGPDFPRSLADLAASEPPSISFKTSK
jgi:hypothetical protein